jgi:hypothetical protein
MCATVEGEQRLRGGDRVAFRHVEDVERAAADRRETQVFPFDIALKHAGVRPAATDQGGGKGHADEEQRNNVPATTPCNHVQKYAPAAGSSQAPFGSGSPGDDTRTGNIYMSFL